MATKFYRKGTNLYNADNNQYISATQFGKGAGFQEVPTPKQESVAIPTPKDIPNYDVTGRSADGKTLLGTLKAPVVPTVPPTIDSGVVSTGMNNGGLSGQLPSTNATQNAIDIYTQRSQQTAEENAKAAQAQLDQLNKTQLQTTQTEKTAAQTDLTNTEHARQAQIDAYNARIAPLETQGTDQYSKMLASLDQINYNDLVQKRLGITNDIIDYSKLMRENIDTSASLPAIQSISSGRSTALQQGYLSKISTAQAALSAIDGNFNLAFDIMEKGANTINALSTDRINFINFLNGVYSTELTDKRTKVATLTGDEKDQLDALKTKLQSDITNVEANKQKIAEFMKDPATAEIASKANLLLTDSPDVFAKKLKDFYANNPQYRPANLEIVKTLSTTYPDAGISLNDTPEKAAEKIKANSKKYQNDITNGKFTFSVDPITGKVVVQNTRTGEVGSPTASGSVIIPQTVQKNGTLIPAARNNNPGNLVFNNQAGATQGDAKLDANGKPTGSYWAKFETPEAGYAALQADIIGKMTGQTRTGLSANSTLQDLINVYAPKGDGNNPALYAQTLATKMGVGTTTKLGELLPRAGEVSAYIAQLESGTQVNISGTPEVDNNALANMVNNSATVPGYYDTLTTDQKKIVSANLAAQGKTPAAKLTPAAQNKINDANAAFGQASALLKQVTDQANKVITSSTPILGNSWKYLGALTKTNADAATYRATVSSLKSILARSLGEKGVLTDTDIKRIEAAIPGFTDTVTIRDNKLRNLATIFNEVRNSAIRSYSGQVAADEGGNVAPTGNANDGMTDDQAYAEYLKTVNGQ